MSVPNFEKRQPSKKELVKYSMARHAEKRQQLAEQIKWVRNLQREDPEEAKDYLPPKELLKRFYEEIARVYTELPFEKEEIEENFSDENLSKTDLEQYVRLLKKVPPRFILHITRQGVRDRVSFHSERGGVSRGFEKILESGELKSVLEQYLQGVITKDSVRNVLENQLHIPQDYPTRKDAANRVKEFLNQSVGTNLARSEISDASALHAAMDFVADEIYGGEPSNEIFFLYPTAYVAAQYQVAAQWAIPDGFNMKDSTMGSQYNDLWLKAKSNNAGTMPVDAAIVFIPEKTMVDPNTGSRFKIDEEDKPVENTEQIDKIKGFIQSSELKENWPGYGFFSEYVDLAAETMRIKYSIDKEERGYMRLQAKLPELEKHMREMKDSISKLSQAAKNFGIADERFYEILDNPLEDITKFRKITHLLHNCEKENPLKEIQDWVFDDIIGNAGLTFQLVDPKKAISSREYWEEYFKRTGKRPSKIIFYEQETPNEALDAFRKRAGLTDRQHKEVDLRAMFAENIRSNKEMHDEMQREREAFQKYAEELLEEIYSKIS